MTAPRRLRARGPRICLLGRRLQRSRGMAFRCRLLGSTSLISVSVTAPITAPYQANHRERRLEGPYGCQLREMPTEPLYLYLSQREWADTWINGGQVLLTPARRYLGERKGTATPDELHHERWDGVSEAQLAGFFDTGVGSANFRIEAARIDRYAQEAIILCFSFSRNESTMARFGNKSCCIEIIDFHSLISSVNRFF